MADPLTIRIDGTNGAKLLNSEGGRGAVDIRFFVDRLYGLLPDGLSDKLLSGKMVGFISPAVLLVLWVGISQSGLFPRQIVVPPQVVAETMWELLKSGELMRHILASFSRLASGYAIGTGIGLLLGAGMGLSPTVKTYLSPSFQLLRQMPTIALLPAFVMLFGVGETIKIVLVAKATALPIALATMDGINGIPRVFFDVAAVSKVKSWRLFTKVVLPATTPPILTGMRIALTRSWMVLVGAELLVAQNGLGQMMEWGRQMFRIDIVFVGVVLTGTIGFALDRGVRRLEQHLVRWQVR